MAAVKTGFTDSQKKLMMVLNAAQGKKTQAELAVDYGRLMKKDYEKGSITTSISLLRKACTEQGVKFPKAWEPLRASGGGRTAQREDLDSVFASLGVEIERIEPESDETENGDDAGE